MQNKENKPLYLYKFSAPVADLPNLAKEAYAKYLAAKRAETLALLLLPLLLCASCATKPIQYKPRAYNMAARERAHELPNPTTYKL
jgi:hypothetical protein